MILIKTDLDVFSIGFGNFEQFPRGISEHPRNKNIGDLFYSDIERVNRVIVKFSPVGNLIFNIADSVLKLIETSIGLQFGIIFCNGK